MVNNMITGWIWGIKLLIFSLCNKLINVILSKSFNLKIIIYTIIVGCETHLIQIS